MRQLATCFVALGLCLALSSVAGAQSALPECTRSDGASSRDLHWRDRQPTHPLVGQVFKGERPITISGGACKPTPLQQLIAELWGVIRAGGVVLLGEVHDNPEHHAVRGDTLWPRLGGLVQIAGLRPAAVFEHIRASQKAQLDGFYLKAQRSRRLWRASDLLRELDWAASGWPDGDIFSPLFDAALRAKLPILPGNAARDRTRGLLRGGGADATPDEEARLASARAMPEPLLQALAVELEASHCGVMPASAFGPMSLAQRYTDAHMAAVLVEAARKHGGAFLLAGNGHVRSDRGVPWHVRRMAPGMPVAAVALLEVRAGEMDAAAYLSSNSDGAIPADYVIFTPAHDRSDPCEKLRERARQPKQ